MRGIHILAAMLLTSSVAFGTDPLRLPIWENDAPLGNGNFEKSNAFILVYLPDPDKANGQAMVICPGGGYATKVMGGEGSGIAGWLNAEGIAGVVLDYRLPAGNYHRPLLDVQRAIRMVREHAKEWHLNANSIGIIGFSAGGHLASTAGTHYDLGNPKALDKVEKQSCRPDFMVLVYPIITMGPMTHNGPRCNLLGSAPDEKIVNILSNEKQVTEDTPPTFLTHAVNDNAVPIENSRMFLAALKEQHVPAELLEFPEGGHGFRGYQGPEWTAWQKRCAEWLERFKTGSGDCSSREIPQKG